VPGGGAALLHLSELVPAFKDTLTDPEEKLGAEIVMKSLRAPARIIAENAGAGRGPADAAGVFGVWRHVQDDAAA
jgi:chaperonin GroEL (HSP60 family)